MSRLIKFRALKDDMSNCNFIYGQLVYRTDELTGKEYPLITTDAVSFNSCIKGTECQFTGLTDKNGKEIYEGDILNRHMNVYWIVKFKNSRYIAEEPKRLTALYLDAEQFNGTEVIGNIHENPELLTNKQ